MPRPALGPVLRLLLAGALATLSACVTVVGTLKADGSGTLEITYPVLPTTTERLEKRRFASPQITLDSLDIHEDGTATAKVHFDDPAKIPTAEMFHNVGIERHRDDADERITVTVTNLVTKEMKDEGKPGPKITFVLPGKVLEANRNATVDGDRVTWQFAFADFVRQKTVDLSVRYAVATAEHAAPPAGEQPSKPAS